MHPQTDLHFAGGNADLDEQLLFSTDGHRAVEVTHTGIEFGSEIAPLYQGSTVTKPVPVMVEGTYKVFNRATGHYEEVTITPEDIQEYAQNTPRDVAMNYEHRKGQDPIGWLRLRDTGVCKPLKTADGEKLALFASMELFPEAADKVKRGVYRDGSIELRRYSKEIIGHALTGFPVMRDTQFYSTDVTPEPEITIPSPAPAAEPAAPAAPAAPTTPTEEFGEMDPKEVLAQALAAYGLKPEDLSALPGLIAATEAERRSAQLITARSAVAAFSTDAQGRVALPDAALDAAAQLYVFGQEHADVQFGEGDDAVTPAGLLERVLRSVSAIQVFGETPGPSADHIEGLEPVITPAEQAVDEDRVAALRDRIKRNLSKPEQ